MAFKKIQREFHRCEGNKRNIKFYNKWDWDFLKHKLLHFSSDNYVN